MAYHSGADLPTGARVLPLRAREIYRTAYDSASGSACRAHGTVCPECAERVAWAAVKRAGFEKSASSGEWFRV